MVKLLGSYAPFSTFLLAQHPMVAGDGPQMPSLAGCVGLERGDSKPIRGAALMKFSYTAYGNSYMFRTCEHLP